MNICVSKISGNGIFYPKSKTYGAIGQIWSLKSGNGCFGLLIHKDNGCQVARSQKNILRFKWHPNVDLHCDHLPDAVFRCAALCITCLFNSGCVLCSVYTMNFIVYPIYTETLSNKLYSTVQLQEAKTKFNPILKKILKLLFLVHSLKICSSRRKI